MLGLSLSTFALPPTPTPPYISSPIPTRHYSTPTSNPATTAAQRTLLDALERGHVSTVRRLLRNGQIPMDWRDKRSGWTILFYAIRYGYPDLVRYLLQVEAELRQDEGMDVLEENVPARARIPTDTQGNTALMIAIQYGNAEAFELYLNQHRECVDMANKQGETALLLAAQQGSDDFLERLLEKGANVNAQDRQGNTALHFASAWGHRASIQVLIEHGCRFAMPNRKGWTALDYALTPAIAQFLQDCARIAYEGRKVLAKRSKSRRMLSTTMEE